jgi:serum/glucocorticoid-regulated kinase 2
MPWFKSIDWKKLMDKKLKPPFVPKVISPDDTSNIDQIFLQENIKETMPMMSMNSFTAKQNHYGNFTYIGRNSYIAIEGNSPNTLSGQ